MPTTGKGAYRYDNGSDTPDGPGQALRLGQDVARVVDPVDDAAGLTAITAAAVDGQTKYQIDVKTLWQRASGAWKALWSGWTTYTPTLANMVIGTGGTANATLEWRYEDDQIHVRGTLTFGTSGSSVGSAPTMTLPVTAAAPTIPYQIVSTTVTFNDVSAASAVPPNGFLRFNNGSTTVLIFRTASADGNLTAAVPFAWAVGDSIFVDFIYNAA